MRLKFSIISCRWAIFFLAKINLEIRTTIEKKFSQDSADKGTVKGNSWDKMVFAIIKNGSKNTVLARSHGFTRGFISWFYRHCRTRGLNLFQVQDTKNIKHFRGSGVLRLKPQITENQANWNLNFLIFLF